MNKYRKPLTSILVKPAGPDCNMACEYCFYLEKEELFNATKVHRMKESVLEEMIKQILEQAGLNFSFGWQGGEPTLMGLSFFEKVIEFQQKYGRGQVVGNGLQTNGILIDQKWAEFLKKYNFLVGLSLDGPEPIHDHYRSLKGGQSSWQKVVDSAQLMLQNEVAVNALSVVNDYSANYPDEIYNFHKELGLSFMQFIPCVETDSNDQKSAAPFSVSAEKYGKFICQIFDLWCSDFKNGTPTTSVRYFDSVFYSYVGLKPPECTLHTSCGIYLVVEHNGDIYSCDFFVEPKWKLGNVMQDRLIDLLHSEKQNEFGLLKADFPQDCLECQWLKHCYGGCTKDRIKDPRDKGLDHFCRSHKMFFEHADARLRQFADDWQDQQRQIREPPSVVQTVPAGVKKIGRNDPCPCGSRLKYKKCCGDG